MNYSIDEQTLRQLRLFPPHDLQSLLTFAGQSRNGKQQDLIERSYLAVKSSINIREKFEELYNHRFGYGELTSIAYPRYSNNDSHISNVDIRFLPLIFNEELAVVLPVHRILPVRPIADLPSTFETLYFLFTAQQASGLQTNREKCLFID